MGSDLYYQAFVTLGSCRSSTGCIPWTAIRDYCNEYDIDGEDRDDMFFLVQSLDTAYMDFNNKEKEKSGEKAGGLSQDVQKPKSSSKGSRKKR
jgi:hypothetical protein